MHVFNPKVLVVAYFFNDILLLRLKQPLILTT